MLQIRLNNKGSASEGTGGGKNSAVETVTVACPDHLVLADLPVAKSIGTSSTATLVKIVGRRSRRHLGERVHFCVRCDFPIAIYGRLSPCEHAFCLDCARSDSSCYLCDERIQKIQTIKMMEGIYICAAPHCLKSFLKKSDFEAHIHQTHADLLQPNTDKEDGNESDATFKPTSTEAHAKQSIAPDTSTARTPLPRAGFSPSSTSQTQIRDPPKPSPPQPQLKPPPPQPQPGFYGRHPNYPPEQQSDRFNRFPFSDFPTQQLQPPNYVVPVNAVSPQAPPMAYNILPFHYETARTDMQSETGPGPEQGSLLGFPPAPITGGFTDYPRPPWTGVPFEPMQVSQGISESYGSQADAPGRNTYFQGEYGRVVGTIPLNVPMVLDGKDGKGVLAAQPRPPPPPPQPRHLSQFQRGGNFSQIGDAGQSYGWQHEKQDGGYGASQE